MHKIVVFLLSLLSFTLYTHAQECSATVHCATGCCSQFGFCGTSEAHCGDGCLSTCDFRLGCDANNPCAGNECCSKFGFCGLGADYCSPENCVAGCHHKGQCDPGGWGAAYVNQTKCALRGCCSQWGFCGMTEEFCGDREVSRPSCNVADESVERVVGYYEGWAARRSCQAFKPEDIPVGVYTHLIFAFASIDPQNFQVVPAEAGDVELYSRVTALKKKDPKLKVYIAIGGWAFNDPGPTRHTFSDLAADPAKQAVFFSSLISFLNTYNFDGVDLDWEYPGAEDRGGRPYDFENYPTFVANLRRALQTGSSGRAAVTMAVPVSFWYLQHFDIEKLEPYLDFFNVMSYDLHGLWDQHNPKWLGAFLNSHTNMTEISEYMDLFWRNNISPRKINLGLAFYSRTFLVADSNCVAPACMFDGVGEAGPCSKDDVGGTLTNAELTDQIKRAGVSSTLNTAAMVKIALIGRKWITYDDEDTWDLKLNWAREHCIGGVMVWAVSHDYTNGLYSSQLQAATKYKSPGVDWKLNVKTGTDVASPAFRLIRKQCYWANCGVDCHDDFSPVLRADWDGQSGEVMQDGTNCRDGRLRRFCCPNDAPKPVCGWFDFNNGKCGKRFDSKCTPGTEPIIGDHTTQVGSIDIACNNNMPQVACCKTVFTNRDSMEQEVDALLGYDQCEWHGTLNYECSVRGSISPGDPDESVCLLPEHVSTGKTHFLVKSLYGAGGDWCRYGRQPGFRPYCCRPNEPDAQWTDCSWRRKYFEDGTCEAWCPDGFTRLAMQGNMNSNGCREGTQAYCCRPVFRSSPKTQAQGENDFADALEYALSPSNTCPWSSHDHPLGRRDRVYSSNRYCDFAIRGIKQMSATGALWLKNGFDAAVDRLGLLNIDAAKLLSLPKDTELAELGDKLQDLVAEVLLKAVRALNAVTTFTVISGLSCAAQRALEEDLVCNDVTCNDPDNGGSEIISQLKRREQAVTREADDKFNWLEERDGSPRSYTVVWGTAPDEMAIIRSSAYPNGQQGDYLEGYLALHGYPEPDNRYISLSKFCGPSDPTEYELVTKGTRSQSPYGWVSEHILELNTIGRFFRALAAGRLEGIPEYHIPPVAFPRATHPFVLKTLTGVEWLPDWPWNQNPAEIALAFLGSNAYPQGLVNADAELNAFKGRLYIFKQPVGTDAWTSCCTQNTLNAAEAAFRIFHLVESVFDYYADDIVQDKHQKAFMSVKDVIGTWEEVFQDEFEPTPSIEGHYQRVWAYYMRVHMSRVAQFASTWVKQKLIYMWGKWVVLLHNAISAEDLEDMFTALIVLINVARHYLAIDSGDKISFDTSIFY